MKKTLSLISCVVASSLMAQGASLVSEWNGFTQNGNATEGNLSFSYGSSSVNEGILNVTEANYTNRPAVDLSSANLSLSGGLTISLEAKGASRGGNLLGLASSETVNLFAAGVSGSGTGLFLFNGSSNSAGNTGNTETLEVTSATTASIITITTGLDNGQVVFKMYENGDLVGSGSANNTAIAQQTLTKLVLGGWPGNSNNSRTNEDVSRLAIYDGAMTAAEVKAAYTAWTVPEPATASLGILGLGTLLLRRRRQH